MAVAASAAASVSFSQILTPVASVVGALITGFGAASFKHRWDVKTDEKRWQRESFERMRAQQTDAFARYLSARPDVSILPSLSDTVHAANVVAVARLAAANLLIILPEQGQRDIIEADLHAVEGWLAKRLNAPSRADFSAVPSAEQLLALARSLALETSYTQKRSLNRFLPAAGQVESPTQKASDGR
jgi:hypothetical protein